MKFKKAECGWGVWNCGCFDPESTLEFRTQYCSHSCKVCICKKMIQDSNRTTDETVLFGGTFILLLEDL